MGKRERFWTIEDNSQENGEQNRATPIHLVLPALASFKEIVRSPKFGGKYGSKLFPLDLLSGFWYCLMTEEGKITTFMQGNTGQLTHAKCCSLDGSPHTLEIS